MNEQSSAPGDPGPGDRVPADRAPGDRSPTARRTAVGRTADASPEGGDGAAAGSLGVGIAYGALAGLLCGLIFLGAAALLAFSAGLVVIALFSGRIVGLSVRTGARDALSPAARTSWAILLTLLALTLALVATWAVARLTGGVLDLPTYLLDTLGPVVPLSYVLATLGAWWGAA